MPIFAWNVPLVSLIFLKRSLVFPILLFSSISLHWSLRKAFLSALAILWNSAFKWVYLSFSPLHFTSLLFTAICKASSDRHFAFLLLGDCLDHCLSYTMSWTSVHSSSGMLSIRSNPLNLFVTSTVSTQGIWFRSNLKGLVVFPNFFNCYDYYSSIKMIIFAIGKSLLSKIGIERNLFLLKTLKTLPLYNHKGFDLGPTWMF